MPSLAWAVVRDGGVTGGGFGGAGPRTIFQAGSVTKIFTALLLADMAVGGEVRLSDPAARYLPGARNAASPVTLADLATHTAGLPRLPGGLSWSARLSPRDPYARYPASWFRRAARRALGAGSGGSPYAYSNFGYGLLGYLLGRAAESTYETLVTTRVCGPLGLADTTFGVPGPSRDRKAQGHQRTAGLSPTGAWARWPARARSTPRPPTWPGSCRPAWPPRMVALRRARWRRRSAPPSFRASRSPAARSAWPGTTPVVVITGSSGITA